MTNFTISTNIFFSNNENNINQTQNINEYNTNKPTDTKIKFSKKFKINYSTLDKPIRIRQLKTSKIKH